MFYERRTVGRVVFGRIYYIVMLLGEVRGSFLRARKDIDQRPLQISANNCHYIIIIISIIANIIAVDSIRLHSDTAHR